ncbi:MAG: phosphate signaling complex protein PhoU [Oscillochloridaceae bacterium]|nr:phosphate signaling complex protein PhoU [Chloroflexaceae bacterium]MDW8390874.1 phosphate signaling complex protein PhoU [Oscillochloridaceae bacterium]
MLRERYARQINSLREDLLRMGSMVEQSLLRALHALETWDALEAARVADEEPKIDSVWHDLEERTIRLLATQQPVVAGDLRLITAVTAIAGELERIGDYANSIARRVRRAVRRPVLVMPPAQIYEMATLALQMINTSLEAFLRQDADLAHSLTATDERVDELEDRLREHLIAEAQARPEQIEGIIELLEVAHALERSADRATNIGERVIYLCTSTTETIN